MVLAWEGGLSGIALALLNVINSQQSRQDVHVKVSLRNLVKQS